MWDKIKKTLSNMWSKIRVHLTEFDAVIFVILLVQLGSMILGMDTIAFMACLASLAIMFVAPIWYDVVAWIKEAFTKIKAILKKLKGIITIEDTEV